MAGRLNQPSSVQDDGPRGCKLLLVGNKRGFVYPVLYVPLEKGPATSATAAGVIRKVGALSGYIGYRGIVGGPICQV